MSSQETKLMNGKKGIVLGIANDRSLAWGIAKALSQNGAQLAVTYLSEALKKRIDPLAESLNADLVLPCNVEDESSIDKMLEIIKDKWGTIDFLVHSIAFADKDELRGRYIDTSRDNFSRSMLISCYSFTELVKKSESIMNSGGSFLTLSYYGAEKVVPSYNVMGVCKAALEASVKYIAYDLGPKNIRVNAISAGPVKTLAAAGLSDFRYILKWNQYNSPLRRNTTLEDVGNASIYLLSHLGQGTTGEVLHVDSGYHIIGIKSADAPDITKVMNGENT